ncbi:MAG: hypothetical protein ABIR70_12895 [Bryobacteraceae bacterium]
MVKTSSFPAFRFSRAVSGGLISILNQNSYLMGTYNQATGQASWHRMVTATEKASVEKSLAASYPLRKAS